MVTLTNSFFLIIFPGLNVFVWTISRLEILVKMDI